MYAVSMSSRVRPPTFQHPLNLGVSGLAAAEPSDAAAAQVREGAKLATVDEALAHEHAERADARPWLPLVGHHLDAQPPGGGQVQPPRASRG